MRKLTDSGLHKTHSPAVLKRFILLFVPTFLISAGVAFVLFQSEIRLNQGKIQLSELKSIGVGERSIEAVIQSVSIDLKYLASEDGFMNLISKERRESSSPRAPADWPVFSRLKGSYDQIRWLDNDGRERVRVNFVEGEPIVVPDDQLQNKRKRYYFTDTIKLNRGEHFMSPLDLNVEHGSVEQPFKPMIRLGTPVFDQEGRKQGVIILNYLGEQMLMFFDHMMGATTSRTWLVNRDGYWLKGPSRALEWGFMFDNTRASMFHRYPDEWTRIRGADRGQFENERGLWTFSTIYPLSEYVRTSAVGHETSSSNRFELTGKEHFWKTVLLIPRGEYRTRLWTAGIGKLLTATILYLVALCAGCWRLAYSWAQKEEAEKKVRQINEGLELAVEEKTENLLKVNKELEMEIALNKQIEERLRITAKAFDITDGIVITDNNSKIVNVNSGFTRITGYGKEDVIGRIPSALQSGQPDAVFNEKMWAEIKSSGAWQGEITSRRNDGEVFSAWLSISRVSDEAGTPTHYVGALSDITELKRAQTEQARLLRELHQAQKMEALGQLTGGIAHDFNNILGIMLGYTELALNRCTRSGGSELVRYLNHVERAGLRAKSLVAQMLAYTRRETSDHTRFDLPPLVEENLKMIRAALPASIEIGTEIGEGLPPVAMDPVQINQLMMNLCINARDAMDGKGTINVRLGWARKVNAECAICHKPVDGDWLELSIADTGHGISRDVLLSIFDPFFTTKDVGKGSGLGLSVVSGIVRNFGGHIQVETELGQGATFRLWFPPAGEEVEAAQSADRSTADLQRGHGQQILVVDDEPGLGEIISRQLQTYGYRATVLTSSLEALELFGNKPDEFALVITDQTMPEITGVELLNAVRRIRSDIPSILTTGFSEHVDADRAAKMHVRYLEKPVSTKRLIRVVGELIKS